MPQNRRAFSWGKDLGLTSSFSAHGWTDPRLRLLHRAKAAYPLVVKPDITVRVLRRRLRRRMRALLGPAISGVWLFVLCAFNGNYVRGTDHAGYDRRIVCTANVLL